MVKLRMPSEVDDPEPITTPLDWGPRSPGGATGKRAAARSPASRTDRAQGERVAVASSLRWSQQCEWLAAEHPPEAEPALWRPMYWRRRPYESGEDEEC